MFNRFFDEYARRLAEVTLPLTVACHRAEDAPLFAGDPPFDRATHGFGWSDPSVVYTCGKRFAAPTGLDALLLYYRSGEGERGADLYLVAAGKIVERVRAGHYMTLKTPEGAAGPHDAPEDQIPTQEDQFAVRLARIAPDGDIQMRYVTNWSGRRVDERSRCAILRNCPRYSALERVVVEEGGRTYTFTDPEIAQLEAAIAEHRGVSELILPEIVEAVRYKYGDLTEGAWRLIAGSLGMSVCDARQGKQDHDDWWVGYARMHDGPNPEA